ncbi:Non-canonical poly(A) RNA polymerase protein Trf4-1 [Psilocybe cubensis]|uniref:Non-canonical poly(A) RNA polymerase protein Trf4-1 n=2 Tax=Psilocybe cubensis TaxID=181762 RepID=A0ACB8GIU9_PSICU|nr:Non-canonical poly(A) RNA polymerase protein Trf4-1 [Psilocybe cubensis]KAH9474994.1 Non-canonical poly(A) RNA polymerase protein Trf4-1 [Psilocybe cubensis]
MMSGLPTRMKSYSDYAGVSIPLCGDFEQAGTSKSTAPWSKSSQISPTTLSLEIKHFLEYMTPSDREIAIRQDVISRFTTLIESINDTVTTYVDVKSLYPKILRSGFASRVETVFLASIPVIKVTDKLTGIEIDLSDGGSRGINATNAVLKWMKKDEEIVKMLFFVVKTFLMVRRCGSTYTGGINSYVLVWMIVAWVNLEWPKIKGKQTPHKADDEDHLSSIMSSFGNLSIYANTYPTDRTSISPSYTGHSLQSYYGEALKGFLSFYGHHFDYHSCAIIIEPKPFYTTKTSVYSKYNTQRYLLCIVDPADASVDMGSKAYGINHVKASFQDAYSVISKSGHSNGSLTVMLGGEFTTFVKKRQEIAKCADRLAVLDPS